MAIDANEMNRRLIALAEHPDARFWRVDFDQLSVPERVFLIIWELEAEVNNGGFEQYFLNDSGRLTAHAVNALRTIGAEKMASIVELAIYAVGKDIPWSDSEGREASLKAPDAEVTEQLEELDQAFMAYPDNLNELLYQYVSDHKNEIGAPVNF